MYAVITGASRGMGKAMAFKFAAAGYNLIISAKTEKTLFEVRDAVVAAHPDRKVIAFTADLTKKQEVIAFGQFVLSHAVPDILINNAGTYIPGNCIDEADGAMEYIMDLNFYSAYHLTRILLPEMIKRRTGHIFNMCSIASLRAYEGGGSYGVSKYAILGFTRNLRLELMPHGIKVTAVFPGAVQIGRAHV